jgi:hypothetical protein
MADRKEPQKPIDILSNIPDVKNVEQPDLMFSFNGAWMPSTDGALIGPENFQELVNMRYNDSGIEGITGYTAVNDTAITTHTTINSGIHLKTADRTQTDYVLVHASDPTDSNDGAVYQNKGAIGEASQEFETTPLHEDTSKGYTGRFSPGPAGVVAFANTEVAKVWEGEESFVGSVFTTTDAAEALPIDVTERAINSRTDSANYFTIQQAGTGRRFMTILSRRPLEAIKFYIKTGLANATASTLACQYWDGTQYTTCTTIVDGTASPAGTPFAQTGWITFDDTKSVAKLKHFEERYMYAYQVSVGNDVGFGASITEVTCRMSMQAPTNIWDGIYRTPIQCQVYDLSATAWEDYTLHVSEGSSTAVPVGLIMDAFTDEVATASDSDRLIFMFDEPMAGIRLTMLGNLVNKVTNTLQVRYWSGDAWVSVGATLSDGTSENSITFAKSGLVSWNPPATEEKITLFGTQGYAYEFTTAIGGAPFTDTTAGKATEDVVVDLVSGIPKQVPINNYKFPLQYKNKLLWCGYTLGNEGNRIDYSVDNGPDIYNGEESSMNGYQSVYVGGTEPLTCGAQLYNRFGSNLFASCVLFKNAETYLLVGDSPLDYKLYPVSKTIGCPAPQSLATAELGIEVGEKVARNVAIFCSNSGPMIYDGATLAPIHGLDVYFDPNESIAVNFDYLDISKGWFDATYREYNLMLATGSSTSLNIWLVYDIVRKKWYQKDTGVADRIQCGFGVIDTNGDQHIYAGSLVGKLFQLENGASWAGSEITNEVRTGDFFPSQNEWDITRIRRLKFSAVRVVETGAQIGYSYYQDTDDDGGYGVRWQDVSTLLANSSTEGVTFQDVTASYANSGTAGVSWSSAAARQVMDVALTSGLNRLMRHTQPTNHIGWCHSFKFTFSSSSTLKGMQPIMWGVQWEFVRKDHYNL